MRLHGGRRNAQRAVRAAARPLSAPLQFVTSLLLRKAAWRTQQTSRMRSILEESPHAIFIRISFPTCFTYRRKRSRYMRGASHC